jgi:hypothetical protein
MQGLCAQKYAILKLSTKEYTEYALILSGNAFLYGFFEAIKETI